MHTYLANRDVVINMKSSKHPFKSQESEFKSATYPIAHINIKDDANNSKNYQK